MFLEVLFLFLLIITINRVVGKCRNIYKYRILLYYALTFLFSCILLVTQSYKYYALEETVFFIPETVDKALYEFSQFYAYTYIYRILGYTPFWFTLTSSIGRAGLWSMAIIALFDPMNNAHLLVFYAFFWYYYQRTELCERNRYALHVAVTSSQIYEKLILEISKLDDQSRIKIFEEIFCIYRSYMLDKDQKMYLILFVIENLL